jgi:hypothetical protein
MYEGFSLCRLPIVRYIPSLLAGWSRGDLFFYLALFLYLDIVQVVNFGRLAGSGKAKLSTIYRFSFFGSLRLLFSVGLK